jgi:hypothetical protein
MNISNIPNELHKEIIDKDGQKIVFDFKDMDKSKEEYIRLTQDEYGKLKECAAKRKKVNKIYGILGLVLFILGIIIAFRLGSWWSLLILVISFAFIVQSDMDCRTTFNFDLYGYGAYVDVKYRDVGMRISDIISILALEEEFRTISEIADIDTEAASKFEVNKDHIDFLYVDSSKMPHTMSFNVKGTTKIYYENIDYILIRDLTRNETTRLSITLPLKYSDKYKALVE